MKGRRMTDTEATATEIQEPPDLTEEDLKRIGVRKVTSLNGYESSFRPLFLTQSSVPSRRSMRPRMISHRRSGRK